MKTKILINRKSQLSLMICLLSLAVTSCGTTQNSAYQDNDGVYSTKEEQIVKKDNPEKSNSVQYRQYFSSLQSSENNSDIFTDVNSYSSGYTVDNDSIQAPTAKTGYASWGSNPESTTVVYYSDPFMYGWGYPYYGYPYYGYPYYGWGYYPGWGYPGWGYPGWGYPGYHPGHWYPHVEHYAYSNTGRGSGYAGDYRGNYGNNLGNRVTPYTRDNSTARTNFTGRNSVSNPINYRNSSSIANRSYSGYSTRNSSSTYRNYTPSQTRTSGSDYRGNNSSSTYQRSYTPSSNNTYQGGSNMSGGGGRISSGGGGYSGGGGRVGGAGGRR